MEWLDKAVFTERGRKRSLLRTSRIAVQMKTPSHTTTVRTTLLRSGYSCQPLELAMTPDALRLSQNTRRKAPYSGNSALLKF